MDFFTKISGVINNASRKAKKKIDTTKLEIKNKNLNEEIKNLYGNIGEIYYKFNKKNTSLDIDEKKIQNCYINIDKLYFEIRKNEGEMRSIINKSNNMRTLNTEMKNTLQENIVEKNSIPYKKLNIKEDDLRVTRTNEGIKILRFCPVCKTGNNPDNAFCSNCNESLKNNIANF